VEGAQGPVLTGAYAQLPDAALKADLCDKLLRAAELTGAESYAITSGQGDLLWGVEDERYHLANVDVFRSAFEGKEALAAALTRLQRDLKPIRKSLYNRLVRTDLQRSAAEMTHEVDLLKRLVTEQLTTDEVRDLGPRLQRFTGRTQQVMAASGIVFDGENLADLVSAGLDFYAIALLRDKFLADNTLGLLSSMKSASGTVVLVAGGFHTPGITKILESKGASYIVVTPALTSNPLDRHLYNERLLGRHVTPLELLSGGSQAQTMVSVALNAADRLQAIAGLIGALLTRKLGPGRAISQLKILRSQSGAPIVGTLMAGVLAAVSAQAATLDTVNSAAIGTGIGDWLLIVILLVPLIGILFVVDVCLILVLNRLNDSLGWDWLWTVSEFYCGRFSN